MGHSVKVSVTETGGGDPGQTLNTADRSSFIVVVRQNGFVDHKHWLSRRRQGGGIAGGRGRETGAGEGHKGGNIERERWRNGNRVRTKTAE